MSELEALAKVAADLHHALQLTKGDAEKLGAEYGPQANAVKALRNYEKWAKQYGRQLIVMKIGKRR